MNAMSTATVKPSAARLTVTQSLNSHLPYLSQYSPTISFRSPHQPPPLLSFSSPAKRSNFFKIQAKYGNATPRIPSIPFLEPLKSALVATTAAAAIFFAGFYSMRPSIAALSPYPIVVEKTETDTVDVDAEKEKAIEEHLISNPHDVDALKNLMEMKIKSKEIPEAIEVINKLMEIEPEEVEWPMMRAHLYAYNGEVELARQVFNELLKKNPFLVEAYHGLVTVASQDESGEELEEIEKKIQEAIGLCKKDNRKSDLRDFKLLFAQIKVLEGGYDEALKIYQELVKEEPRDFRPYLCQGIIYTLLRKNNEAEKSFEKYRRLVPKGHPYAGYFDDNMIATKLFAQKMENERAAMKS